VKITKFDDLLKEHDLLQDNQENIEEDSENVRKLDDLMIDAGISEKPMKVADLLYEAGISEKPKPEEILAEVEEKEENIKPAKKLTDLLDEAGIPTLDLDYKEEVQVEEKEEQAIKEPIKEDVVIEPEKELVVDQQTVQKTDEEQEDFDPEKELIKRFDNVVKGENKEFDSSWIERSEFASVVLGSDLHPDVNSDVVHNLNTPYHDLSIKILVKLKDNKTKKEYQCELQKYITPDGKYGIHIAPINDNIIRINTGSEGIILYIARQDGGIEKRLLSDVKGYTVYYRIIVRRAYLVDAAAMMRRGAGYTSSIPVGVPGQDGAPGPPGPQGPAGEATITVQELDGDPIGTNINKLTFNQAFDSNSVYINGQEAIIGAPANAPSIDGSTLTLSGATQYTGRLSQSNINYEAGVGAGSSTTYIQNDTTFILTSQTDSGFGDKGILKLYINSELVAAIDLANNFVEANRSTQQDINDYDTDYVEGSTFTLTDGVCPFLGTYTGDGSLELVKVEKYNDFEYWQSFQVKVNITSELRQGYNYIYLKHIIPSQTDRVSNTFKFFYDNDAGINPNCTLPSVVEATPVWNWLSGVKYYGAGSTFNLDFVAQDVFDNVYHNSNAPVEVYGWPGMGTLSIAYTDPSVSGVSTPPDINESMTVNDYVYTQAADQSSDDARLYVRPRDPYGTYTAQQTASGKWLIHSYSNPSDDLHEYFRDEDYRMTWDEAMNDWDSPPANKTGNWDSTQSLIIYDSGQKHLQCFLSELIYPTMDFSSGYKPTGNPNYSAFTGMTKPSFSQFTTSDVAVYVRGFYDDNENHTNGKIYISGITGTHLTNIDIEVFIKVPGKTGWCTLNELYNAADYTGADGDGCRINPGSYDGPTFEFTLGTNFTDATTKWGIIVMIIMKPTSPEITGPIYIVNW